ncbi:MAG: hypothetical protein EA385_04215 [Salinarimonadaceae bacterium]|nr:MAG: hypothetical protein EA385_04215 [Salinarimonadaceae bacterium]
MSPEEQDMSVFDAELDGVLFHAAEDFYHIGRIYALGKGLPVDLPTGYVWLRFAASRGSRRAARLVQQISAELDRPELARAKSALRRLTESDARAASFSCNA